MPVVTFATFLTSDAIRITTNVMMMISLITPEGRPIIIQTGVNVKV